MDGSFNSNAELYEFYDEQKLSSVILRNALKLTCILCMGKHSKQ